MAKWLFDAGHGGTDPGAVYRGRTEAADVLRLTKDVGAALIANGESVSYTRTADNTVSLSERSNMDLRGSYDYFVSIHRNAYEPEQAKGVETHIYSSGGKANQLASKVNAELVAVGFINRGVKVSNFHVLRETKSSAILIECGFIDNSGDNSIFDNQYNAIVNAIVKGCLAQVDKTGSSTTPAPNPSPAPSNSGAFKIGAYDGNVRITTDSLRIRNGRGTENGVIGELKRWEVVRINYILPDNRDGKGDDALWGSFDYKGTTGYIHLGYAEPTSGNATVSTPNPKPSGAIDVGSKVKITGTHYSTGQAIPSSVKAQTHTVMEMGRGKALLKEIYSWVNLGDLSLVSGGSTSSSSKLYVNLPGSATSWNVYPTSKAPVIGNECGKLNPAAYCGLSYEVLGNPQANVYTIQSPTFGKVNIYCGPDTSAKVSSTQMY